MAGNGKEEVKKKCPFLNGWYGSPCGICVSREDCRGIVTISFIPDNGSPDMEEIREA